MDSNCNSRIPTVERWDTADSLLNRHDEEATRRVSHLMTHSTGCFFIWPRNQIAKSLQHHPTRNYTRRKQKECQRKTGLDNVIDWTGKSFALTQALAIDRIKCSLLVEQASMQCLYGPDRLCNKEEIWFLLCFFIWIIFYPKCIHSTSNKSSLQCWGVFLFLIIFSLHGVNIFRMQRLIIIIITDFY